MTSSRDYATFKTPLPHPGEVLREDILPGCMMTPVDLARRLKIEARAIEVIELISERRPVTGEMALRLGKLFGTTPEFWMNLQTTHDLSKAALENREAIAQIQAVEVR